MPDTAEPIQLRTITHEVTYVQGGERRTTHQQVHLVGDTEHTDLTHAWQHARSLALSAHTGVATRVGTLDETGPEIVVPGEPLGVRLLREGKVPRDYSDLGLSKRLQMKADETGSLQVAISGNGSLGAFGVSLGCAIALTAAARLLSASPWAYAFGGLLIAVIAACALLDVTDRSVLRLEAGKLTFDRFRLGRAPLRQLCIEASRIEHVDAQHGLHLFAGDEVQVIPTLLADGENAWVAHMLRRHLALAAAQSTGASLERTA